MTTQRLDGRKVFDIRLATQRELVTASLLLCPGGKNVGGHRDRARR
jgi:hypothetical protein